MKECYAKRLKELCETNGALRSDFRKSLVHFDMKGADVECLARVEAGFEMISGAVEFYAVRCYEVMEDNTRLKDEIRELKGKYKEPLLGLFIFMPKPRKEKNQNGENKRVYKVFAAEETNIYD